MIRVGEVEVSCIRSGKGDCIHLRFLDEQQKPRNIVVDTGPTATAGAFRSLVHNITGAGETLDLLLITHYDDDHIGGILRVGDPGFRAVYFNAYEERLEAETGNLSALQNQRLFHTLPKTIVHPHLTAGDEIEIGGASIAVIGPSAEHLAKAKARMRKAEKEMTPLAYISDWQSALSDLAKRPYPSSDLSVSNLSSIIFVFEYHHARLLFCGDAPANAIVEGMHRFCERDRPHFDLVKLPHHGSIRNLSDAMLAAFEGNKFLICADGTSHPNKQTIAKILMKRDETTIYSNYNWWLDGFLQDGDMEYIRNGRLMFQQV